MGYVEDQVAYLHATRGRRSQAYTTASARVPNYMKDNIIEICKRHDIKLSDWIRLAVHNELDRWNGKE